jgi:hypothetical protein
MIVTVKLLKLSVGTFCFVATTLYQGNADSKNKFLNIYQLTDLYSKRMCCWNVATCKWKVHNRKIEIISLVTSELLVRSGSESGRFLVGKFF